MLRLLGWALVLLHRHIQASQRRQAEVTHLLIYDENVPFLQRNSCLTTTHKAAKDLLVSRLSIYSYLIGTVANIARTNVPILWLNPSWRGERKEKQFFHLLFMLSFHYKYGICYIRFLLTYRISMSYRYRDTLAISYRYRIEFQKPISLHHYIPQSINRNRYYL